MNKFQDIIAGDTPVLVDFFAEWCGPCKMMKPVLEELKKKMGNKIIILKIDIDKNISLSSEYRIQSLPLYYGNKAKSFGDNLAPCR